MRVCALVVSTATGVDPLAHLDVAKGKPQLQYARALWVHLVVGECNINRGRCSYLCQRSLESIRVNLREVEEWRSDPAFDAAMERWAGQTKRLIELVFDVTLLAPPPPAHRERLATRAALTERAA